LTRLENRDLAELGLVDVTAAPFSADPTGETDSTIAIADAVFFARHRKMAVWFPAGDYLVSDTIRCEGGWCDLRTTNYKCFPYCELWGCVLMGDQRADKRARIVLAANAAGFDDPEHPKPIVDYVSYEWKRHTLNGKPPGRNGNTGHNQTLLGIDIVILPGNPGAAAVSLDAAEGSTLQDSCLDVGEGYTAILGGPGCGGAIYNMRVRGGHIGALLNSPRPPCTLVGCSFEGQRDAAVVYCQRGPLTMVGCDFRLPRGVAVLQLPGVGPSPGFEVPAASLIDCRVEYPEGDEPAVCVEPKGAVYVREVWVKNGDHVFRSDALGEVGALKTEWMRVTEMAVPACYRDNFFAAIHVDAERRDEPWLMLEAGGEPPADLLAQHIWDELTFPTWNSPGAVNVRRTYGARGDGETDDTDALQRAIDENEIVFLPHGAYRVSRTLRLKPNTKLLGLHAPYTMIAPLPVKEGDFADCANPRPVIQTADTADADTQLSWLSVFMPRELAPGAYMLDWRCGGSSRMRCVFPLTGITENELEPLAKGIFPWHNWTWQDFKFPNRMGNLGIKDAPRVFDYLSDRSQKQAPGMDREATPNHPMTIVTGHGAGGWYPFMALDARSHGPDYRRILVHDCDGPFRLYHAHLQYIRSQFEMEIVRSSNVSIFGIKNEEYAVKVWARDSEGLLIVGLGGVGNRNPEQNFLIENCRDTVLACHADDCIGWRDGGWGPKPDADKPTIREIAPDGTEYVTPPFDLVAMYRRT